METGLSLWGIGTYVPEFRSRILPLARPCCTPNRLRLHRFVKPWRRPRGGESEHSQYRCLTADPSHPARGRFSGRVRQRYLNQLLSTGRTPLSIVSHDSGPRVPQGKRHTGRLLDFGLESARLARGGGMLALHGCGRRFCSASVGGQCLKVDHMPGLPPSHASWLQTFSFLRYSTWPS